tara:strand:+ start:1621 stop:2157 length:537 start_codon:yes stop_codon:yes gene_type:complete
MEFKNLEDVILEYAQYVVRESRQNLASKKNADGELYKSIAFNPIVNDDAILVEFLMEDYGTYLDRGVKGVKSYYRETRESPFSYKSKGGKFGLKGMPPTKAFDQWVIKRDIAPRDKKGRFLTRKSLKFLIARSIFFKGIKARKFFSKPFYDGIEKYELDMQKAFVKDIESQMIYLENK